MLNLLLNLHKILSFIPFGTMKASYLNVLPNRWLGHLILLKPLVTKALKKADGADCYKI